jgi:hypothetical protein
MTALSEGLRRSKLVYLSLAWTGLTDEDLRILALALQKGNGDEKLPLKHLNLSSNSFGDAGVDFLVPGIAASNISTLELKLCHSIQEKGWQRLAQLQASKPMRIVMGFTEFESQKTIFLQNCSDKDRSLVIQVTGRLEHPTTTLTCRSMAGNVVAILQWPSDAPLIGLSDAVRAQILENDRSDLLTDLIEPVTESAAPEMLPPRRVSKILRIVMPTGRLRVDQTLAAQL